jgi:cytochrome c oxidase cbb3-type subunit 4
MTMDINILREAVTVASFAAFLGIVAFAVHPLNKKRFDEAARLPLDDEPPFVPGQEGR